MVRKINRTWRVVLSVFVLLVAFRLALPYIVTRYVNNVLGNLQGYNGSIQDVDLHLLRGAYQLDSLQIFKANGKSEIPFVSIPVTDISIEWKSLLNGAFVSEVIFDHASLNFIVANNDSITVGESDRSEQQTGKETDWVKVLKKLLPAELNRLKVLNGKIAVYDLRGEPRTDIVFSNLNMDALNLSNATGDIEKLPSRIYLQALSTGNGQLNIALRINPMKQIPDLDMDLRFENVDLKALSELLEADMENGNLNLYSEMAVTDGKITGYVKPLFTDLEVNHKEQQNSETADFVWGSMVSFLTEVFEKQHKNEYATSIPLDGKIQQIEQPFLPALWNVFSSSFAGAFENRTPRQVNIASYSSRKAEEEMPVVQDETKSKKEIRKEKRREKREERKRAKKERKEKTESGRASKKSSDDNS